MSRTTVTDEIGHGSASRAAVPSTEPTLTGGLKPTAEDARRLLQHIDPRAFENLCTRVVAAERAANLGGLARRQRARRRHQKGRVDLRRRVGNGKRYQFSPRF